MVYGKDSNFGKAGNLESVSYGEARAGQGSNRSAISVSQVIDFPSLEFHGVCVGG
jgi:hypothetical protein